MTISFTLFLTLVQFVVFFILVFLSAYCFYHFLTTKNERSIYRLKLQKEIEEKRKELIEKELDSPLQVLFEQADLKFINAFRYQIIRIILGLFLLFYYLVFPYTRGENITVPAILFLGYIFITESRFKYSLINITLNYLINRKAKAKTVELFTLFDMLRAELYSLNEHQEVNVYNTIKNVLPMFSHINGTLSRFLSLWKRSPRSAKDVFYNEIGGENAKALADILYMLDNVSKEDALKIIEAESTVFSVQYYEKELQRSTKSSTAYFGLFFAVNILIVVWLIVYVYILFEDRIDGIIF